MMKGVYIFAILSFLGYIDYSLGCGFQNKYIETGVPYFLDVPYRPFYGQDRINCYYTAFSDANTRIETICDPYYFVDYTYYSVRYKPACDFGRLYISETGNPTLSDAKYYCGESHETIYEQSNKFSGLFRTLPFDYSTYFSGLRCVIKAVPIETVEATTQPTITTTQTVTNSNISDPVSTRQCGIKGNSRIVNGVDSDIYEWPWQVSLVDRNGNHFCGGCLISENYVLTASHCAVYTASAMNVVLGEHNTNDGTYLEMKGVSKIITHENYNEATVDNDIALLKLSSPVEFREGIQPLCIPENLDYSQFYGKDCWVTGWGTDEYQGQAVATLQEVNIPVLSTEQCKDEFKKDDRNAGYASYITDNMICTYKNGYDSCQGDSGGCLACEVDGRYYCCGIVSWGIGCGGEHSPGVYTKLKNYYDWINTNTV